jgi:hypothetical protein
MYRWQREFYESTHKFATLVASNQSGKSAIQIRKVINWATNKELWPKLWKKQPIQFWYLYPDGSTASREFQEKWVREFLPSGAMKDHPVYGWESRKRQGDIDYIRFNTGVTVYFKTYSQNVHYLQAGSCHAIFADEEVPWDLIPELTMRIAAFDGYMNFAFTATRGQDQWRRVVEERGKDEIWREGEVDILKIQVTAYDCLYYEDGTPSTVWTVDKIEEAKRFLATDQQIQRRIYGKFIKDEGLKYPAFDRKKHFIEHQEIDLAKGHVYAGVDYGSGTNHRSSITLVWVAHDYTHGYVFDVWIGERNIPTDAGTVVLKYKEMIASHGVRPVQVFYDWACADLKTIANSTGLFFEPADKNHATGERILNTLFKLNMLQMMDIGESYETARQLETITLEENKKYSDDDGADSLRYALTKIPWNYTDLNDKKPAIPLATNNLSRYRNPKKKEEEIEYVEDTIIEWDEYLNSYEEYGDF